MWEEFFSYQFIQNAFIASFFSSIVCGIIGVIIVEKRLVMMSGGIAHTSYGGVGLGYLLNFEPIIGAFIFSICAAFGIGYIGKKSEKVLDVVIGLFWSLGMSLGIFFIALMPGYPPDLTSYLFGNILSVTKSDIYLMGFLTFVVVTLVVVFFDYWKSYLFDEEFASITGMKTTFLKYLLLILIAMSVVVLIRVVGIILILALFTAPTAIAGLLVNSIKNRMIVSIGIGSVFCIIGILSSYLINMASGAAIVILSAICYSLTYLVVTKIEKRKKIISK
jgi:zinc transport system permease protein